MTDKDERKSERRQSGLREQLIAIPQMNANTSDSGWNRYDTDDSHVLHVWSGGKSWDVIVPKGSTGSVTSSGSVGQESRTPAPETEAETQSLISNVSALPDSPSPQVPAGCEYVKYSSRVCERGTRCCVVEHAR